MLIGCVKKLDTIHAGNLEAHVKRRHSGVYHEIQIDKEKIAAKRRRLKEKNERPIKKIKVEIDRKYLQDTCLELVTANARPFSLMEDTGFQKLINSVIVGLGGNFSVNAENVRGCVDQKAVEVREKIK